VIGVHEVNERPFVGRRQDLVDEARNVRAAVRPHLAKPSAKARAIDQRVGYMKKRPAVPKWGMFMAHGVGALARAVKGR
jgi:hypothetical protein